MAMRARQFLLRIHPSAFLLAAQILLLILYAIFDGLPSQRALLSASGVVVLILRIWVIKRTPAVDWIAWALAVPSFFLSLLSALVLNDILLIASSLFEAALYFYAAGSLIAYMMEDYEITKDEIYAAGATFTLLAWGYAYLFLALQTMAPGSFVIGTNANQSLTFVELLFLSFTNLSATGLSDISPTTAWARVIIMMEQFTGVGYVAMVVSRLVGLTLQRQARRRSQ